jgi:hypothetical protein
MKNLIFLSLLLTLTVACSSSNSNPTMTPLQDAGCAVESALTSNLGAAIAGITGAANPAACGQALQVALGNINLCAIPVPPSPAPVPASFALKASWKVVGDISADDLKAAKIAKVRLMSLSMKGIVGSIVCPLVDDTALGLFSANIPAACQGPNVLSAGGANQALVAACDAAIPI